MVRSVRRHPGLFVVAALALVGLVISAAAPPPGDDKLTLHDAMDGMKDGLKTIGSALQGEGTEDEVLEGCQRMQTYMLAAKVLEPTNLDEVEEAKRPAHIAAFRADMARAMQKVLEIEIASLEGRKDDALAIVRGDLFSMRDAAHDKYQPADEKKERGEQGGGGGRRRY